MRIDLEDVGGDDVLPAVVFEIAVHDGPVRCGA
jgi:hypothetical protein